MSYETTSIPAETLRSEFYIQIKHANGSDGFLPIKHNDLIVTDASGGICVLENGFWPKVYRPHSTSLIR